MHSLSMFKADSFQLASEQIKLEKAVNYSNVTSRNGETVANVCSCTLCVEIFLVAFSDEFVQVFSEEQKVWGLGWSGNGTADVFQDRKILYPVLRYVANAGCCCNTMSLLVV